MASICSTCSSIHPPLQRYVRTLSPVRRSPYYDTPEQAAAAADYYNYKLRGTAAHLNLGLTADQRCALDQLSLEQLQAFIKGRGDIFDLVKALEQFAPGGGYALGAPGVAALAPLPPQQQQPLPGPAHSPTALASERSLGQALPVPDARVADQRAGGADAGTAQLASVEEPSHVLPQSSHQAQQRQQHHQQYQQQQQLHVHLPAGGPRLHEVHPRSPGPVAPGGPRLPPGIHALPRPVPYDVPVVMQPPPEDVYGMAAPSGLPVVGRPGTLPVRVQQGLHEELSRDLGHAVAAPMGPPLTGFPVVAGQAPGGPVRLPGRVVETGATPQAPSVVPGSALEQGRAQVGSQHWAQRQEGPEGSRDVDMAEAEGAGWPGEGGW